VVTTSAPEATRPQLVCEYAAWMRDRRGLAETTIAHSLPVAEALLGTVSDDPGRLDAAGVRKFVLGYIRRHATASAGGVTTTVRCFLRWLVAQNRCATTSPRRFRRCPRGGWPGSPATYPLTMWSASSRRAIVPAWWRARSRHAASARSPGLARG